MLSFSWEQLLGPHISLYWQSSFPGYFYAVFGVKWNDIFIDLDIWYKFPVYHVYLDAHNFLKGLHFVSLTENAWLFVFMCMPNCSNLNLCHKACRWLLRHKAFERKHVIVQVNCSMLYMKMEKPLCGCIFFFPGKEKMIENVLSEKGKKKTHFFLWWWSWALDRAILLILEGKWVCWKLLL